MRRSAMRRSAMRRSAMRRSAMDPHRQLLHKELHGWVQEDDRDDDEIIRDQVLVFILQIAKSLEKYNADVNGDRHSYMRMLERGLDRNLKFKRGKPRLKDSFQVLTGYYEDLNIILELSAVEEHRDGSWENTNLEFILKAGNVDVGELASSYVFIGRGGNKMIDKQVQEFIDRIED